MSSRIRLPDRQLHQMLPFRPGESKGIDNLVLLVHGERTEKSVHLVNGFHGAVIGKPDDMADLSRFVQIFTADAGSNIGSDGA